MLQKSHFGSLHFSPNHLTQRLHARQSYWSTRMMCVVPQSGHRSIPRGIHLPRQVMRPLLTS